MLAQLDAALRCPALLPVRGVPPPRLESRLLVEHGLTWGMCRIGAKSYHKGVCKHRHGPGDHRRRIWIPQVNELGIDGRGMALHGWWLSTRSGRRRAGPRMAAVQRKQSFSCTHLAGILGGARTLTNAVET